MASENLDEFSVIVTNIPVQASNDSIQAHFQNKKNGGGELRDETIERPASDRAILRFVDKKVAMNVLETQQKFGVDGVLLTVSRLPTYPVRPAPRIAATTSNRPAQSATCQSFYSNISSSTPMKDIRDKRFNDLDLPATSPTGAGGKGQDGQARDFARVTAQLNLGQGEAIALQKSTVIVTDIPRNTSKKHLELYFKAEKHSQGGEITNIDFNEEAMRAEITYADPKVAERVANFKDHKINKVPVKVSPDASVGASGSSQGMGAGGWSISGDDRGSSFGGGDAGATSFGNAQIPPSNTIIVTDIPRSITTKHLELFFKSEKFSRGGEIKQIDRNEDAGTARITYVDFRVAELVSSSPTLIINKALVNVRLDVETSSSMPSMHSAHSSASNLNSRLSDDSPAAGDALEGSTIIVTDIPANTPKKHLELYFKAEKHSQGGEIKVLDYNEEARTAQITYADPNVAARVTSSADHKINKVPVTVRLQVVKRARSAGPNITTESGGDAQECSLIVKDIPRSTPKKHIELYFKSEKNSQGGEIQRLEYDEETQTAEIVFCDPKVAERVANRTTHKINKIPVAVSLKALARAENLNQSGSNTNENNGNSSTELQDPSFEFGNCVEVANISAEQEEVVRFYFEDLGDVESTQYISGERKLLVFYSQPEDARRVLSTKTHSVINQSVQVQVNAPRSTSSAEPGGCALPITATVLVTGIPCNTYKEHLNRYFKSEARSGGGEIVDIAYERRSQQAIITFASVSVAIRVLRVTDHRLCGATLKAALVRSSMPAATGTAAVVTASESSGLSDRNTVIVHGIPPSVSCYHLRLYFKNAGKSDGGKITGLDYNPRSGIAFVSFSDEAVATRVAKRNAHILDQGEICVQLLRSQDTVNGSIISIECLSRNCKRESLWWWLKVAAGTPPCQIFYNGNDTAALAFFESPVATRVIQFSCHNHLDGEQLRVSDVAQADTILVSGFEKSSEDYVTLYFENVKSGGSPDCIKNVTFEDTDIKVTFKDPSVLKRVLAKKDHVLNQRKLEIVPYYPQLGPMSENQKFTFQSDDLAFQGSQPLPPLLVVSGFAGHSDFQSICDFFCPKDGCKSDIVSSHYEERDHEFIMQLKDAEAAQEWLDRSSALGLVFCGTPLTARPRAQRLSPDMELDKLLIRGVQDVSWDLLRYFIWALCKASPISKKIVIDDDDHTCMLVRFAEYLKFERGVLPWLPAMFQGRLFDAELVYKPTSVYVADLSGGASNEYLKLLFEENNATLKDVRPAGPGRRGYLLKFSSYRDVDKILKRRIFYEDNLELTMTPEYSFRFV